MRRLLRDIKDAIESAGGIGVTIEDGGRHTVVHFLNPQGERHFIPVHKGSNPKRYEDALRSQLRRRGLQP
jgi:hypothetical protein